VAAVRGKELVYSHDRGRAGGRKAVNPSALCPQDRHEQQPCPPPSQRLYLATPHPITPYHTPCHPPTLTCLMRPSRSSAVIQGLVSAQARATAPFSSSCPRTASRISGRSSSSCGAHGGAGGRTGQCAAVVRRAARMTEASARRLCWRSLAGKPCNEQGAVQTLSERKEARALLQLASQAARRQASPHLGTALERPPHVHQRFEPVLELRRALSLVSLVKERGAVLID
jgi:hypothetical protein